MTLLNDVGSQGQVRPASLAARIREAQGLADERRYREAEVAYRAILIEAPDTWIAANNLGALHARTGELESALECFLRAQATAGDHEAVAVNLADVYLRLGRNTETVATCARALGRGCRSGPLYHALIEAAVRQGKHDLAAATIEEYRPQIRDQQEFFAVSLRLLECFVAQGRTVGVPWIAEDLLGMPRADRPDRWLELARVLRQAGVPDLAYRALARVPKVGPECVELEFEIYRDFEEIEELLAEVYSSQEEVALHAFRSLARFRTAKLAEALRPLVQHDDSVVGKLAQDYLERIERNRTRRPGPPRYFTSFAPTLLPPIVVIPQDDGPVARGARGTGTGLRWQFSPPAAEAESVPSPPPHGARAGRGDLLPVLFLLATLLYVLWHLWGL